MVTELPLSDAAPEPRLRIVGPVAPPAEPEDDEALLAAIAAGDHAALGRLYDRHAALLFAIVWRIVGDREAAEEVLQEVFLRVWRQARLYDAERGAVRHWLQ
ncbi:MAG TPA: sigma factor, partial [Thermomicrobiales bacterium]|nr:sigma factor [Thermomicrobiales bacterium]